MCYEFSDSEIVASILSENGYNTTQTLEDADLVLVNTCSIRDKGNKQFVEIRKI
jgi:tRNA-2-methylthio-N6-dimethylallyladenosine synthase